MNKGVFSGKFFRRISNISIISVFLVIFAGAFVRTTGAGMGCPDWPTCFGMIIPPTDESQLPADYKERYKRENYSEEHVTFNVTKTWTEYINRLIGALAGLFFLLTAISSLQFWRKNRNVTILAIIALILMGIQGWLGMKVVFSALQQWLITIHMVLALIIVACLLLAVYVSRKDEKEVLLIQSSVNGRIKTAAIAATALTLLQVILGTQVREQVDHVNGMAINDTDKLIELLGSVFRSHEANTGILILFVSGLLWAIIKFTSNNRKDINRCLQVVLAFILLQITTGVFNLTSAFPAVAQVTHITLGATTFGFQFYAMMVILFSSKKKHELMA